MAKEVKTSDPARFDAPTAFAGEGADIDTSDLNKKDDSIEYAARLCAKLGVPFSVQS